jgi:hypothetical protein
MRKGDLDLGRNASRVGREEQNAIAHEDRLFNVVGHQQHRFGGEAVLDPQIEKIGANGLGGQHIEGRKGLVHQQNGRFDDE